MSVPASDTRFSRQGRPFRILTRKTGEPITLPATEGTEGFLAFDAAASAFGQLRLIDPANPIEPGEWRRLIRSLRQRNDREILPEIVTSGRAEGRFFHFSALPNAEPVERYVSRRGPLAPERAVALVARFAEALIVRPWIPLDRYRLAPGAIWIARDTLSPRLILGEPGFLPSDSPEEDNARLLAELSRFLGGDVPVLEGFRTPADILDTTGRSPAAVCQYLNEYGRSLPPSRLWTEREQPFPLLRQLIRPRDWGETLLPPCRPLPRSGPSWPHVAIPSLIAIVAAAAVASALVMWWDHGGSQPDPVTESAAAPAAETAENALETVRGDLSPAAEQPQRTESALLEEKRSEIPSIPEPPRAVALRNEGKRLLVMPGREAAAFERFVQAAELGDAESLFLAGRCLLEGTGCPVQPEAAAAYLERSARAGHGPASTLLGACCLAGNGVPRDETRAVRHLRDGVDAGDPVAFSMLGSCFLQARGVERDAERAADLFTRGSELGDPASMFLLARCFEVGFGRERNPAQARDWYRRSADAGYADAIRYRQREGSRLGETPDER